MWGQGHVARERELKSNPLLFESIDTHQCACAQPSATPEVLSVGDKRPCRAVGQYLPATIQIALIHTFRTPEVEAFLLSPPWSKIRIPFDPCPPKATGRTHPWALAIGGAFWSLVPKVAARCQATRSLLDVVSMGKLCELVPKASGCRGWGCFVRRGGWGCTDFIGANVGN